MNTKADILSRKDQVNTKKDNKDIQILKDKIQTRINTIAEVIIIQRNQVVEETILLEEIQRNNTKDQKFLKELEKNKGQAWKDDRIIYVKRRIYIPNNQRIQEQILQENYNPADIGYLEQQCMLELIKKNYQWLEIKSNIKKYVQECTKCQQNKIQHIKKARELHPLETPEELWQEISIDITRPLSRSKDKDIIIVIVDQFTKIIRLKAIITAVSSEDITKIY